MGAQEYDIKHNILFQDNQSAIKMEKNGKKLYAGKSIHVYICYLFAGDRVESNKMSIELCSKEHMLADFYEIPTRGPVREISWRDHGVEARKYLTDGTTLNQGVCWKCG